MASGAESCCLKNAPLEQLVEAILTQRELEVLALIAEEVSYEALASYDRAVEKNTVQCELAATQPTILTSPQGLNLGHARSLADYV